MKKLLTWTCVATVISLSGCSMSAGDRGSEASGEHTPTSSSSHSVMSAAPDLLNFDMEGKPVLTTGTNTSESIDVTPFTSTTGRIALYSDCVGFGEMTVAIGDDIESSHDCREGSDEKVHRVDLFIDPFSSYTVAVTTDSNQPWTITVAELPPGWAER